MSQVKKFCFLLVLSGLTLLAFAQEQVRFKKLSKADGLSNNNIFDITHDQDGFIWIGTRNGLNRFDGYRVKVYPYRENDPASIISNDIRNLYYDSLDQSLWIGTQVGLSRYNIQDDSFDNFFEGQGIHVIKVLRDSRGRLIVATNSGLYYWDQESDGFALIRVDGKSMGAVAEVMEDGYQQLWIVSDQGLLISRGAAWYQIFQAKELYPELAIFSGKVINKVFADQRKNLWFGCENSGLLKWHPSDRSITTYLNNEDNSEAVSTNRIRDIISDTDGNLWIGTSNGIYITNGVEEGLRHLYNDGSFHEGLSNNSIKTLHVDKKGGIWIGTYFRGINYYDKSFSRFNIDLPYPEGPDDDQNIIAAITSDDKGNIWIGTEGRGLGIWDNRTHTFNFIANNNLLKETNVKSIYPYKEDLWIGTYKKGLMRYSVSRNTSQAFIHDHKNSESLPSNNIYDIEVIKDQMWMASFGAGLVKKIGENSFISYQYDANDSLSISDNYCRVLYLDYDGDFWVGTNDGLNRIGFEGGVVRFKRMLPNVTIYSIYSFRPNEIWIGTFYKGLYRYDKLTGTFTSYTDEDGMPGNTIYSILADSESLWTSTNNGIAKLNFETNEVMGYQHAGELKNLEYSQNASLNYRNSLFLFGSSNGLMYFNPSEIKRSTYQPNLVITNISSLNDFNAKDSSILSRYTGDSQQARKIQLENHNTTLEIKLASLDYSNPSNIQYAYRMKGLEENWRYNKGKTEAFYYFQREGDYTFEAKATNGDGIWNDVMISLNISVMPPWYRTWWAYLIYTFSFLGFLYLIFKMVRLQNSYQLEHLANQEQVRTHEMKIRFFTNITHEFRTPLTLMLGPLQDMIRSENTGGALRTKLQGVFRNVHRLSHLVDQLLVFRKIETDHMKMRVSEGHINDFLQEIYLAFKDEAHKRNIDYQYISDNKDIMLWYDADKLERVFFNLISNALKFTPDFGSISVLVKETDEYVEVRVNDDGKGVDDSVKELIFERFYERSTTNYSNYGIGIGLSLSKQIVELHSGSIFIEDNVERGSSFVVRLLKGTDHFDHKDLMINEHTNDQYRKEEGTAVNEKKKSDTNIIKETKLLIVEDDPDVCEYLKTLFKDDYTLLIETNGKSGYDTAKRELPDIILSDVMMPVMDGITMCSKLKTTLETSHIPVVLLTARSSVAYKIGGLETGADDYLTKPFNSEELVLKIKNLVKTREIFLKKIVRIHNFDPEKIAVTSTDEKFLTRLVELTEEYIENSNLTIEQFADELHVSRALLFTKIKALTGQTPKGFVKNFRLKRAVQLLDDSDLKVSQIAYKCGFKDYRYFTKVFKSQYQMTPKEYREDKRVTLVP